MRIYKGKFDVRVEDSRDSLLTFFGKTTLQDRYVLPGESFQDLFARVATYYSDDQLHAQRLYDYFSQHWAMPATPVLSNGGTRRGLPISCFLQSVDDSMESIIENWKESAYLSKNGGGLGISYSNVRSIGEAAGQGMKTSGIIPFIKVIDSLTLAVNQGGCLSGESEILTENGWVRFDELNTSHGKVLQVDKNFKMSWTMPIEYHCYDYNGNLHQYRDRDTSVDMLVTDNHKIVYERAKNINHRRAWTNIASESISREFIPSGYRRLKVTGNNIEGKQTNLTNWERFLIAYQADGSTNPNGTSNGEISGKLMFTFKFSKERKIERFKTLCDSANLEYTYGIDSYGATSFRVRIPIEDRPSKLFSDWIDISNISSEWAKKFIEELHHWDGSLRPEGSIKWNGIEKSNVDMIQIIACMAGYRSRLYVYDRLPPRQTLYEINIYPTTNTIGTEKVNKTSVLYSGKVYCVTVPTGMFLSRHNGITVVTGNSRRSSAAIYLNITHPEIEEFLDMRRSSGGDPGRKALNLHHGIVISDDFMRAVEHDKEWILRSPKDNSPTKTVKARDLWIKLLTTRLETGEPYVMFENAVNHGRSEVMKKLNHNVTQSNLCCVSGDTPILTKKGYFPIQSLKDKEIEVFNGIEWSNTIVRKTGEDVDLYRVHFSDGDYLDCTKEHKFYIYHSDNKKQLYNSIRKNKHKKVSLNELKVGDSLIKFDLPICIDGEKWKHPYVDGFMSSDGTYDPKGTPIIWLYGKKRDLAQYLRLDGDNYQIAAGGDYRDGIFYRKRGAQPKNKFEVPINGDLSTCLLWFAGVCDGAGTIAINKSYNLQMLQLSSCELKYLKDIRLMLNRLGIQPKIKVMHEEGIHELPNHVEGNSPYKCRKVYRLLISAFDLQSLYRLGFQPHRLKILDSKYQLSNRRNCVTVESIEKLNGGHDSFCFNEPKLGRGVFNGYLTGNSEILLPTGKDHLGKERTAVCCLSSLNLEYYDQWKNDAYFIPDMMRFLDNVLQDFINHAPDEMAKAYYSAIMERSIGLGVMGLHSLFQAKGLPFGSRAAKVLNQQIFFHIKSAADYESKAMAIERGACPDAINAGIVERFSNKMAIAPTASISIIAGTTSPSIEPISSNAFSQKTLSGTFTVKNRHLKMILQRYNKDTDEVWQSITLNKGSVQHLDFLSVKEKEVYKTAFEIDQMSIIELAADRTPFIDQGQSLNLFLPSDISKKDLHKIHFSAWKLGLKTLYYCRSLALQRADAPSQKMERVCILNSKDGEDCAVCQ